MVMVPLVSVVDDDESVRESLPDMLRELGFAVLSEPPDHRSDTGSRRERYADTAAMSESSSREATGPINDAPLVRVALFHS